MSQQTAVEWLASNLDIIWEEKIIDLVEQAKQMEKEQLFKVWNYLSEQGWGTTEKENREDFEEWFSKTA
jgi:hypothetical protein